MNLTDVQAITREREEIFRALLVGRVPKRIPVSNSLALDAMAEYGGVDVAELYWDMSKAESIYDKVVQDFYSDTAPGAGRRYPSFYQILGSKPFVMSSTGHMQHPNVEGMMVEDYDELIASPLDTIIDKILPRLYTELDTEPNYRALIMAKALRAQSDEMATLGMLGAKMKAKYGFASIGSGATTAPYDFMADFFRSFTGISKDIRRIPDKVIAACEALTPILIKKGKLMAPTKFGFTMIPLHMGPYMREKDFAKFYWPSLKAQCEGLAAMGHSVQLFVEHDFMRFLDYLYDLPENTILRFEYGDPKIVKEKLGKKHIISGFYPLMLLHTGTKEQCIDKAKELLDILAPGGRFWFNTDKGAMDMHGNITENLQAVLEYVYLNGSYDNPDPVDDLFVPDPTVAAKTHKVISEIDAGIQSKYFTTWSAYREKHPELAGRPEHVIAPKMEKYEDIMFNFIINLCS